MGITHCTSWVIKKSLESGKIMCWRDVEGIRIIFNYTRVWNSPRVCSSQQLWIDSVVFLHSILVIRNRTGHLTHYCQFVVQSHHDSCKCILQKNYVIKFILNFMMDCVCITCVCNWICVSNYACTCGEQGSVSGFFSGYLLIFWDRSFTSRVLVCTYSVSNWGYRYLWVIWWCILDTKIWSSARELCALNNLSIASAQVCPLLINRNFISTTQIFQRLIIFKLM